MNQNKSKRQVNRKHQHHLVTLNVPHDMNVIPGWMNLLIESIFNVFGSDLILANWFVGKQQIFLQSRDVAKPDLVQSCAKQFWQVLQDYSELSAAESVDFHWNLEKLSVNDKSDKIIKCNTRVTVVLSLADNKVGYLGIFMPPAQGKYRLNTLAHLQSPTEIITALEFLWSLMTTERNRLDAILNSMIDGVLLMNEQGDVLFTNKTARKILGLGSQSYLRLPNLKQAKYLDITEFLEEVRANRYEALNKIKKIDAIKKIVGINIQKLRDRQNRVLGWMTILRDITADWEMERLRKEFIAKITHELRSPLTVVSEGIALVTEGNMGTINADQRRCLEYAHDSISRMDRLIDNLLRITRLEISEQELDRRKKVCFNRLLQKIVDSYQHRIDAQKIQLRRMIPETEIQVRMDRDRLTQVVLNLLDNALKYTAADGWIEIGLQRNPQGVYCWVQDSGIGVPIDQRQKIFEKFYRIDNDANQQIQGHGLGLAIAREILAGYGGKIWVEDGCESGSRFIFHLPVDVVEDSN